MPIHPSLRSYDSLWNPSIPQVMIQECTKELSWLAFKHVGSLGEFLFRLLEFAVAYLWWLFLSTVTRELREALIQDADFAHSSKGDDQWCGLADSDNVHITSARSSNVIYVKSYLLLRSNRDTSIEWIACQGWNIGMKTNRRKWLNLLECQASLFVFRFGFSPICWCCTWFFTKHVHENSIAVLESHPVDSEGPIGIETVASHSFRLLGSLLIFVWMTSLFLILDATTRVLVSTYQKSQNMIQ